MDLKKTNLEPYVSYDVSNVMKIRDKYGFRVTLGYLDKSRKVCQHAGYAKKADAGRARNAVVAQLHDGIYVTYTNVSVAELLGYWLEEVMRPRPSFTANSYRAYKDCIEKHIIPRIGGLKLLTLNQGHLMGLYQDLAGKYAAIPGRARTIMNTAMRFALSKRLAMSDPCKDVGLPKKIKKSGYHTVTVEETQTYTLGQAKRLLEASKGSRIHMQVVLALLMGLRKSEINGLKYSDIDYKRRKLRVRRQLGEDLHGGPGPSGPNMKTKQEIRPKTASSCRELDIPDYVFQAILEERKTYEKNRRRRQHGRWVFQDLDYICCSSYGRPRSKNYHYQHYKKLLQDAGLPYIRFHALRHTYATLLMKNDINQKAVAAALGHSHSMITVDTYTDTQAVIADCTDAMQDFITEVHPYDGADAEILENVSRETTAPEECGMEDKKMPGTMGRVYDFSDVDEMEDLGQWHGEE